MEKMQFDQQAYKLYKNKSNSNLHLLLSVSCTIVHGHYTCILRGYIKYNEYKSKH